MRSTTDKQDNLLRRISNAEDDIKAEFKRLNSKIQELEQRLGKVDRIADINMAMNHIRSIFDKYTYLDLSQEVNVNHVTTYGDLINKLESHMEY